MLKPTPKSMADEVKSDQKAREPRLEIMRRQRAEYAAARRSRGANSLPENPAHEFLTLLLPSMAYDNPRVRGGSQRVGPQKDVATAMQAGWNRWVKDSDFATHLARVCVDFAFYHGASKVSQIWKDGPTGKKHQPRGSIAWPTIDYVNPHRFALDPLCGHWTQARWMADGCYHDRDDLEKKATDDPKSGWDTKELKRLAEDSDRRGYGRSDRAVESTTQRKEVLVWDAWMPEYTEPTWPGPDEGVNGGLLTFVLDGSGDNWIRKPRPFYGPRWGPYTVYGAYIDPESPLPVGPLGIVHAQIDELQDHARSLSRSCTMYKRLILVDAASSKKLAGQVKSSPDSFVIPVEGLRADLVLQIEVGGITAQQLQQYMLVRERVNQLLAMGEAMRGAPKGDITATADSIASEASKTRSAYLKRQFIRGQIRELKTIGWGMYHNDEVVFPLGAEQSRELGADDAFFKGGDYHAGSGFTYDDIECDIEPYSTEFTSESVLQARTFQGVQQIVSLAPAVPQMPWVEWKTVFQQIADALNNPALASAVNVDMAMKLSGGQGPIPGGVPMLAKQVGGSFRLGNEGGQRQQGGGAPQQLQLPASPMGQMQGAAQTKQAGMAGAPAKVGY